MESKDIKTITLRVNSEDAAKKLEELQQKLEKANAAREESVQLEKHIAQKIEEARDRQERLNAQLHQGNLYEHEAKRIKAELKKTEKEIAQLERDRTKSQKETTRQIKEVAKAQGSIDKARGQYAALERTMKNLGKATVPELKNSIRILERTLNSGAVERGTKEWETFEQQLRECNRELSLLEKNKKQLDTSDSTEKKKDLADFGLRWAGIANVAMVSAQALERAYDWGKGAIDAAARMSEHMADVTKYTGLTKETVFELNDAFKQMNTRTPREQLNDLAADAGKLGIQSKQKVLEFVEAANMINVALGEDLGEDAVKNIGKLAQLFGDEKALGLKGAMLATASTINELSQTSSASEPYIMEFTSRLAGVGHQAGMTQAQVMAFAAVLDQGMVGVEKGATALQNILTALMRKPEELAKIAGLNVKEFTTLLKTDANAALLQFIEAVKNAGNLDAIAPMLDDMKLSGSGVTQVMTTLASSIDNLRQTQVQATAAFLDAKSVQEEYEKANSTPLAQLEKQKNLFHDAAVELGQTLTPVYTAATKTSTALVHSLIATIRYLGQNRTSLLATAAAIAVWSIALKGATIAAHAKAAATLLMKVAMVGWRSVAAVGVVVVEALKVAYYRLTGQTLAAAESQIVLSAAMKATPWGLVASLIATAIAGFIMLASSTKKATKELSAMEHQQRALSQAKEKANQATAKERASLEVLLRIVEDGTRSYAERKKALDTLNAAIPGYHGQLSKSGQLERANRKAVLDYIRALEDKATAEALYEQMVENKKKILSARRKVNAKQTNVNAVNKELQKTMYESQMEINSVFNGPGNSTTEVIEGNGLRREKLRELQNQTEALTEAQAELNRAVAEGNAIAALSNDAKYKTHFMAAALQGATEGDNGSGKGYTPNTDLSKSEINETERRRIAQAKADIEKWMEEKKQIETANYQSGQITLREHREALLNIEREARIKQRDIYKAGSVDWMRANAEIAQFDKEQAGRRNAWSIEQLDIEQKAELRALEERAAISSMKEEKIQEERGRLVIKYLEKRRDYHKQYGMVEEHAKAEIALQEEEHRQKLDKERKFAEKVKKLREEYAKKSSAEVMQIELDTLNAAREKGLVDEDTYQKMLLQIRLKYQGADGKSGQMGEEKKQRISEVLDMAAPEEAKNAQGEEPASGASDFGISGLASAASKMKIAEQTYANLKDLRDRDIISQEEYTAAVAELDKKRFEHFTKSAEAAYATVGVVMQSLSAYQQASTRLEEAKTAAKYDAEIRAAEGNAEKVKKLEAEKAKALADIKTKANKKAMAIEIAQATAAAAMAALNAYKSTIGLPGGIFIAPIAAAAAAAFGAIQIATIAKQHEAQEAGYYEGGFTGGTRYRRRAGVVHEGEFVANHHAVQNPNVLPVLRLLDHAQKNNTVASLTATDVSRAIAPSAQVSAVSGAAAMAPTLRVVPTESPATLAAIRQLAEILSGGIEATVAIDGRNGVAHQLKKYNELQNRK